ncbi:hypothetical protein SpCBS45565_g02338 [Spizellomyces sp. 'palustris']|nr:hypothetical protein SpCBS45565_g02338 [Spizellomyces sp. 'palustris']
MHSITRSSTLISCFDLSPAVHTDLTTLRTEIASTRPNLRALITILTQTLSSLRNPCPLPHAVSLIRSIASLPYIRPTDSEEAERLTNAVIKVLMSLSAGGEDVWAVGLCCCLLSEVAQRLDEGSARFGIQVTAVCRNLVSVVEGLDAVKRVQRNDERWWRAV